MISEFHLLTEKISELAALTHSLRRENAELRKAAATLAAHNAELAQRMQEAHDRVAILLANMPALEQDREVV